MNIQLTLACFTFGGTLLFISRRILRYGLDAVGLFVLLFIMFYGLRALILSLGLDVPLPEDLFQGPHVPGLLSESVFWLSLYLLAFAAGLAILDQLSVSIPVLARRQPSHRRLFHSALALTACAAVVAIWMLIQFGGFSGTVRAAKVGHQFGGLHVLSVPANVGVVVSAATTLHLWRDSMRRVRSLIMLFCVALNSLFVLMWGSRTGAVAGAAILVLGFAQGAVRRPRKHPHGATTTRLLLSALLIVAVAAGLRAGRSNVVHGEVSNGFATASVARQISLATNSQLDASMLAFRDWPERADWRNGQDFINGIVGIVPGFLWEDKPQTDVGKWFRGHYDDARNGWPPGTPTVWFLNFGPAGLLFGGLLAGLIYAVLAAAQRQAVRCPYNLGVIVASVAFVFQLGWSSKTPMYLVLWWVPLWLVTRYVQPRSFAPLGQTLEQGRMSHHTRT